LGPSGAGKSTLIRGIVGRVVPDAGAISIFGFAADSAEARMAPGWVPQELALYPRLSCRENLESFGRYHGLGNTPEFGYVGPKLFIQRAEPVHLLAPVHGPLFEVRAG